MTENLTASIIIKESLFVLESSLKFSPARKHFDKAESMYYAAKKHRKIKSKKKYVFKKAFKLWKQEQTISKTKIGQTLTIRKPQRYETK